MKIRKQNILDMGREFSLLVINSSSTSKEESIIDLPVKYVLNVSVHLIKYNILLLFPLLLIVHIQINYYLNIERTTRI